MSGPHAPPSPPLPEAEASLWKTLRWRFMRDVEGKPQDPPPAEWGGMPIGIPRRAGGVLAAVMFPRPDPKGVVILGHPGLPAGKGYFHRNDRVPFARDLGMAVVTFDHGGFGESDPAVRLFHTEWEDVLAWARRRFPNTPIHVWGVSLGGYFAHHALARDRGVRSAIFEHVAPDILRYGKDGLRAKMSRFAAWAGARDGLDWLPAVAHAPNLRAERVLYVWGGKDTDVLPVDSERLWVAAGPFAQRFVVDEAGHLGAWKTGGESIRERICEILIG